jgi:heme A synthase
MVVPVIAITIVVLAFVVVLIWKRAGSPRELSKKSARWFLAVGLLYMVLAVVVTALVSGTESAMNDLMNMDLTLFNLGLLLFIIGLGGLLVEKLRALLDKSSG